MSNVPQIPGFYYDSNKRKYFKIVNGDQRLNSSYSNNTIRAKSRTNEFHTKKLKPQVKSLSPLSIAAHRYKTAPTDRLLNLSLGLCAPPVSVSPVSILSKLDSCEKRYGRRVRGTLSGDYVLVSSSGSTDSFFICHYLKLYRAALFVVDRLDQTALWELAFDGPITVVSTWGMWAFVQWGQNHYRLIKWVENAAGSVRLEEKTQVLATVLGQVGEHILLPDMRMCGKLHNGNLYMLTENRWLLEINLDGFSFKRRLLSIVQGPILMPECSGFSLLSSIFYFKTAHELYLYRNNCSERCKWSFPDHIHRVFVEECKFLNTGDYPFYLFVIVTTTEVYLLTLCSRTMETVGTGSKFSIHNNNNARPMVTRFGSYVIIEETPDSYKLLDLQTLAVEDVRIPFLAKIDRSNLQIHTLDGVSVVSTDDISYIQS